MPFAFLARSLHERRDDPGLEDEVGNGRASRPGDVVRVKRAFGELGRYPKPKDGLNGSIDRPLDGAITGFQRDRGLRVDGFLRPGGSTQRALESDLAGELDRRATRRSAFDRFGTGSVFRTSWDDNDPFDVDPPDERPSAKAATERPRRALGRAPGGRRRPRRRRAG